MALPRSILAFLLAALAFPAGAAQFPQYLNYQGKLANTAGNPLTGTYSFRFKLYDRATGGTALFSEDVTGANALGVINGLYSVQIGSYAADGIPASVFHNAETWLEIDVNTGGALTGAETLSPRERLTTSPFAFRALNAEKLGTGVAIATFTSGGVLQLPYGVTGATATFSGTGAGVFSITASSGINVQNTGGVYASFFSGQFIGDGSKLTNLPPASEPNTYASSKTFTQGVGVGGDLGLGTVSPAAKLHLSSGTLLIDGDAANSFRIGASTMLVTSAGNLGIGTADPTPTNLNTVTPRLVVSANGVGGAAQVVRHTSVGAGGALLHLSATRGTDADSHAALLAGDGVGTLHFAGSDGVQFIPAAQITSQVDGTPGAADMPGRLTFYTTPDGSNALSERMRIDSAGNVGIGTPSPAAKLQVSGDASFGSGATKSTFTTTGNLQLVSGSTIASNGTLSISTAASAALTGAPAIFVNQSGSVGVGTAGPVSSNGQVDRILSVNSPGSNNTAVVAMSGAASGSLAGGIFEARSNLPVAGDARLGQLGFGRLTDATAGKLSSYSEIYVNNDGTLVNAVRINANGNLGVGTAAPTAKLHVGGAAGVDGIRFPDGTLQTTAAGGPGSGWTDDGTVVRLTAAGDNAVVQSTLTVQGSAFSVGGSTLVVESGKVGVGTAPGSNAKLHVAGGIKATGSFPASLPSAAGMDFLGGTARLFSWGADVSTKGKWQVQLVNSDGTSSIVPLFIDSSGNVGLGTVNPAQKLHLSSGTLLVDGDAANSLKIGVSSFVVTSAGNVGVGAASPSAKLHVGAGTTALADTGAIFLQSGDGAGGARDWKLYSIGTGNFGIRDMGFNNAGGGMTSDALTIAFNTGNVGVGTASPVEKLQVAGAVKVTGAAGTNLASAGALDFFSGYTRVIAQGADPSTKGGIQFNTASSDASLNTIPMIITPAGRVGIDTLNPTQKLHLSSGTLLVDGDAANSLKIGVSSFVVTSEGNVGVGAASPVEKLDVNGAIFAGAPSNGFEPTTTNGLTLDANATVGGSDTNAARVVSHGANSALALYTANAERLRVDKNGLVGIGTTSPARRLDLVDSADSANQVAIQADNIDFNIVGNNPAGVNKGLYWHSVPATGGNTLYSYLYREQSTGKLFIGSQGAGTILETANGGNVGIGVAAPTEKLDVNGNVKMGYQLVTNDCSGVDTCTATCPAGKQALGGGCVRIVSGAVSLMDSSIASTSYTCTWSAAGTTHRAQVVCANMR